jgi:secreted trypsin-like serine protease
MLHRLCPLAFLLGCFPAIALVGGAPPVEGTGAGRHVVLIVGSRGNSCTGTAIARDLVLTAAHCVLAGAEYKLVEFDAAHKPSLRDVADIARHPQFKLDSLLHHRATADMALLKLPAALPEKLAPVPLANRASVAVGDHFTVVGYGVTVRGDGKTGGTARAAVLAATGRPGTLQIRLVDPATLGERPGLGACTADSGAPAFEENSGQFALVGVVSWSTGPGGSDGCGGLTGVTPIVLYRDWIIAAARRLGSPLAP